VNVGGEVVGSSVPQHRVITCPLSFNDCFDGIRNLSPDLSLKISQTIETILMAKLGILERCHSVNISILHVLYQILIVWERKQDEWKPHVAGHHLELYERCPLDTKIRLSLTLHNQNHGFSIFDSGSINIPSKLRLP